MVSVSGNSTASSALALMRGTSAAEQTTLSRVATGKKVDKAADNAAYWSIATTMKAANLSLSSAEDATAMSAAVSDTAALGLDQANGILSEIQSKLIMAKAVGSNKQAINGEISQLKEQLTQVTQSASFSGQNWLALGAGERPKVTSMVSSVGSDADGNLEVNVTDFDTAQSTLTSANDASDGILTRSYLGVTRTGNAYEYYLLDRGSTTPASSTAKEIGLDDQTSNDEIDGMIAAVNTMRSGVTNAAAAVGATSRTISANTEFLNDLQDVNQISIGRMVDADMEEEATRLSAQQVQSRLQTIGLNIANSQQKSLSQLFL
ncbi:flagellin N-terminal helical domain-containing protein [Allorhizobium undicola]|uniref:flagellin N-terminal helical domain-containing protein n=1 Tax=Allorhizobium undicola TaxID=78527 RepID=UPI0004848F97|nr:flagellin [Allorhizobium undicola]